MMDERNLLRQLKKFLDNRSRKDQFSGVVLLAKHNQILLEYVYGLANKEKSIPITIDTKFNLGSANKMFTGVAIAQLVEKNLLSIDDNVGKHLADYPNKKVKDNVTIHHLLTHTSGLGGFIDIRYRGEFFNARKKLTTIRSVVDLFMNRPLPYKTGEFHYSPDGYEILGLIIEVVSGQNYYNYVKENIFTKAKMPNTDSYEIDPDNPKPDIAIGYTNRDAATDKILEGERFTNLGLNLIKGTAGGSGYSTCYDLLNFTRALQDYKLLSPEMTKEILSKKITVGTKGNQTKYQGYGFQIFDINGILRIGHPGRFAGVNTSIDMYTDLGYAVIILSNYDPPSAYDIAEKFTALIS